MSLEKSGRIARVFYPVSSAAPSPLRDTGDRLVQWRLAAS
jgi:hypothetical protein